MPPPTMRSMVMGKATQSLARLAWGEHRATLRSMRNREEKLRAIFLDSPELPDRSQKWVAVNVREEIMNDVEFIRILGEINTWKYLPEEVADVLFKDMRGNMVRPQDFDDVSANTIIGMSLRLLRIYLTGANQMTRKLMPKVMQVDRVSIGRQMFMSRVAHGVEMEAVVAKVKENEDYESDDNFDFDAVDFDEL
jgi:hypothetical protein